jgi:hypothetical protein
MYISKLPDILFEIKGHKLMGNNYMGKQTATVIFLS